MIDIKQEVVDLLQDTYQNGITLDQAEKEAAFFLSHQLNVSDALKAADLDVRMRKNSLKAVKAAIYMELCTKGEKKPTESFLEHALNTNPLVSQAQDELDEAEVNFADLTRQFGVYKEGHIYYRGISKNG